MWVQPPQLSWEPYNPSRSVFQPDSLIDSIVLLSSSASNSKITLTG